MARSLNLGILAHVDAGKTTLTERLLYNAGVIDEVGRVDDGNTQADTLDLERQRGITIKSAVVSFAIDDVVINLIDTPGHPDFIAEVERVLGVLDGAVLVVSAVEGVQAQTRILMRALRRLNVPTLIFVNKIDRAGADYERVFANIGDRLSRAIVAMSSAHDLGRRGASASARSYGDDVFAGELTQALAEHDDSMLAAYVDGTAVSGNDLQATLAEQTQRGLVFPVYAGSAATGAGVSALQRAISVLLPNVSAAETGVLSGRVFKVERGRAGEKVAYARMFSGTISTRDRVVINGGDEGKVTAIAVFDQGVDDRAISVRAGQIGKLWGLDGVRIGDTLGEPRAARAEHHFAPPTLETAVVASRPSQKAALRLALTQLAEQDPLIDLRQDDTRQGLYVSLYGEVQKQVIQATLQADYGLETTFQESTMICVERPIAGGEAVQVLNAEGNPYLATIGLRIEPGRPGSGVRFRLDVDHHAVPLYLYKSIGGFAEMMEMYVGDALRAGPHGWRVVDCVVTMFECRYSSWDGPPKYRGPLSGTTDFRDLTPVVVRQALADAGTRVCAPMHSFRMELPSDTYGVVSAALAKAGGVPESPEPQGDSYVLNGEIPAGHVHGFRQVLPSLTRGEGVLETEFSRYA